LPFVVFSVFAKNSVFFAKPLTRREGWAAFSPKKKTHHLSQTPIDKNVYTSSKLLAADRQTTKNAMKPPKQKQNSTNFSKQPPSR